MKKAEKNDPAREPGDFREGFRWCEREGCYLSVRVCETRARREKRCSRCWNEFLQYPLPFPGMK